MSQAAPSSTCPEGHPVPGHYIASQGCATCRSEKALDAAVLLLISMEPALDPASARAVIESVAVSGAQRRRLLAWLAAHPDGLRSGTSDAAPCDARLLAALAERGIDVALPRCLDCARVRPLIKKVEGGRVCHDCDKRRRAEACAICGQVKVVACRQPDGRGLCQSCRTADPSTWRSCGRCGELARVVAIEGGVTVGVCCYVKPILRCTVCGIRKGMREWKTRRPLCSTCSKTPRVPCSVCGLEAPASANGESAVCARCRTGVPAPCAGCGVLTVGRTRAGQPQCVDCYRRPVKACGRCGRVRAITRSARGDNPDLCAVCWKGPVMACEGCGRVAACRGERKGRMLCVSCRPVTPLPCAHCGKARAPAAHWHEGPVCGGCYNRALAAKATCPRCGGHRRLRHYPGFEEQVCSDCAGQPPTHVCMSCGAEDLLWEQGRCAACVLPGRLSGLLGDDAALAANGLMPLRDALAGADDARRVLDWLSRNSPGLQALRRIAGGGLPLSYDTLEALRPLLGRRGMPHLESLLVSTGTLPGRDPVLAVTERWLSDFLGGLTNHPDHVQLAQTYVRWQILRPLREKSRVAPLTESTGYSVRDRAKSIGMFLDWLEARQLSVGQCRQCDLDEWTAQCRSHAKAARGFITWAIARRSMPRLVVPSVTRSKALAPVAGDQRWAVARRLLHDPGIAPRDRVAGALAVIYAQGLHRIARLKMEDVTVDDDVVSVVVGTAAIVLPEPLATHMVDLIADRSSGSRKVKAVTDPGWLFPGTDPGRPITQGGLSHRLNRLGVRPGQHRLAALYQLAADMPAAIVSDLLGISHQTAGSWARIAGRTWSDYPAMRANTEWRGATTHPAVPPARPVVSG